MTGTTLEKTIEELLSPLKDRGFIYESLYEKSSDSACVYIYRFKKGGEYFDIRTIIGSGKYNIEAYVGGRHRFPSLESKHKSEWRRFKLSHIFKKATEEETLSLVCSLILKECDSGKLFGIAL